MKLRYYLFALVTSSLFVVSPVKGQSYLMADGLFVEDCSGFFLDSGGGSASYGPNESFTATLCSDNSSGTHVQLVFSGVILGAGDNLCFFDGEDTNAMQLSCASDFEPGDPFVIQATAVNTSGCLTIQFTSDDTDEGEGWSADINCVPACQLIQAELISSMPEVMPADTGWIDVCQSERVFFTGAGVYPQNGLVYNHSDFTSDFYWDFGDGTQAVGPNVTHVYDESGGYVVQLTIVDQFGCTNTNFLNQRVRVSTTPTFNIGGELDPEVCAGDTVQLNAMVDTISMSSNVSAMANEGSFQTAGIRSDSLPLPDGTGASFSTSIGFTDFSPGQVLTDINDLVSIYVNMEHSWLHDLEITLSCPSGETVILHNYIPTNTEGAGQTFLGIPNDPDIFGPTTITTPWGPITPGIGWDYYWTPDATNGTWRQYATANTPGTLPSGEYSSFDDLEDLLGCPLNGEWTITVTDYWGIDNGFIFSWGIEFEQDLYPSLETFTPSLIDYGWEPKPSIFFQTQDSIAAAPQNAGTASYSFFVTDDFGCTYDTTVNFTVLPETHPDCYSCVENLEPVSDTLICEGESVTLDVSADIAMTDEVVFEAYPLYALGFQNHPPNNPYNSTIEVNSVFPTTLTNPSQQIVSVCIDMETDWNADLRFFLRSPSGALLELSTGNGGSTDGYLNACFTPTATNSIIGAPGPFTGEYLPEGSWNALTGSSINGTWTLIVSDAFGPTLYGTLNSWSITFQSTNAVNYSWSPSASLSCSNCPAPVATPATTTSYVVTSLDNYNCTYIDTITVGVVNQLLAPVVTCGITGAGQLTFDWAPIPGVSQYEVNVIIEGAPSGWQGPVDGETYVVDGLLNEQEVTLEVRPLLTGAPIDCDLPVGSTTCLYEDCQLDGALDGPVTDIDCHGAMNGAVSVSATGGDAPYEYFLDGSAVSQPTGSFVNLAGGDHFVVIIDATFCRDSVFFTINEPEELTATLTEQQSISCNGSGDGQLEVTVGGGIQDYNYQWSHDPALNGNLASGLATGSYSVTVTDANNCITDASFFLDEPEVLTLDLAAVDPTCSDADDGMAMAITTGGTGAIAYNWSSGDDQANASNLIAGNYCVTVTDENGCEQSDCIDLIAPPPLVIDEITFTSPNCFGENTGSATVQVSGGSGGFSYLWDDDLAQINAIASDLSAGFYEVLVTDANGCQVTAAVEVTQPDLLTATANATDVNCNGGSDGAAGATAAGGIPPYSFKWNNTDDGPEISGLIAGAYQVTVTDDNGCETTAMTEVGQPAEALSIELTQTFISCFGENESRVEATADGGTAGYSFAWSDGQTGALAGNLGPEAYTVTVTDAKGCETEAQITPAQWDPISINMTINPPSCNGEPDGALAVTIVSGGDGTELTDYSYQWSTGQSGTLLQNMSGGVIYGVTVTDGQGCVGDTARLLTQPLPITFEIETTDALCNGSSDGTATVTNIEGEFNSFTFLWEDGQTEATATGLPLGEYSVTVSDPAGCAQTGSASVKEPTPVIASWTSESNKCFGGSDGILEAIAAGGTPGYTFTWSNGDTGDRIEGLPAGEYELSVTDANGCQEVLLTSVEQPTELTAAIATTDATCHGDRDGRITIAPQGGTPPYQFSRDNRTFNGVSTLIGLQAGEYDLYVRDANGCIYFTNAMITEPPLFEVDAGAPRYTITYGDSLTLEATAVNNNGPVEFVWYAPIDSTLSCTECQTTVSFAQNQITYELYGIDSLGCEATDMVTVFVEKPRVLAVPTGFTPNNDNQNDRLLVHGQEGTRITLFQVFDRWGELLFENRDFEVNDPTAGWDGTFRGEPAGGGVYIWYVEVEYIDGTVEVFRGQTTLMR